MAQQIMSFGKALIEFQQTQEVEIFQDAKELPQFFKQNLTDDARVIKHFQNDPQANLKVFYYQYLKLCFQFDNPNSEHYVNKIYELINRPDFVFKFPADARGSFYNDKQFKRLLVEFMDFMGQGGITVNKALSILPIIDFVLVCFFRSFLLLTGKTSSFENFIEREPLFEFLTAQFNVETTVHQNCIKFVDTDIFAYQQNPYQVYMVYIDYEKNLQSLQSQNVSQEEPSIYSNNIPSRMLSAKIQKLPQGQIYVSRDASEVHSRDHSSVIQSHENSMLMGNSNNSNNNLNQNFKTNNNYTNTVLTKVNENSNLNSYAKRKEMLSYMGNSQIYDFVDYTSPTKNQKEKLVGSQIVPIKNDLQLKKKYTQIEKLQDIATRDQKRRYQQVSSESSKIQTSILNNKQTSLSAKKESAKFALDAIQHEESTNSINQIQTYKNATKNPLQQQISLKSEFQGASNAKTNSKDIAVESFRQNSIRNQTYVNSPSRQQQRQIQMKNSQNTKGNQNKLQYLQNYDYVPDLVTPDFTSLTTKSSKNHSSSLFGANSFTVFPLVSPTNSSISDFPNSNNLKYGNPTNFANQSFDEKMKRITNQKLSPDHNSKLNPTSITNEIYLSKGVKMEYLNKTSNLETLSKTETKVSSYGQGNKYNSSFQGRNSTINPDQEFTDSFTLQNVNEPQRSSIKQMKTRARAQRKSVGGGFI